MQEEILCQVSSLQNILPTAIPKKIFFIMSPWKTLIGKKICQKHKRRNFEEKTIKEKLIVKEGDRSIEAVTGGALNKKVLLKISQISQENTCVGVSF